MNWFSRIHKYFVSMQHFSSTITPNYLCQYLTWYQQRYLFSTCADISNNKQQILNPIKLLVPAHSLIPRPVFNLRIRQRSREIIWYAYASVYLLLKKKTFTSMHETLSYQLLKANAYSKRSVSHWKLQTLQNLFTYPTDPV